MVNNYSKYFFCLFLFVCLLGWTQIGFGQTNGSVCSDETPKYLDIDLRGKPDSVWVTPVANKRDGRCCFSERNGSVGCIEFRFWLDEDAYGINFSIPVGAEPGGALTYVINCSGPERGVGEDICLKGGQQYTITFCKPGSNRNIYQISSLGKPKAGPPLLVTEGCFGTMLSSGFDPNKPIRWTSVSPGAKGEYDKYLESPTMPTTRVRLTDTNPPAQVVYEISGYPKGTCGVELVKDYVTVSFYTDVKVDIQPKNPIVCFGGSTTQITATGSGGGPPYTYRWFKDGALLSGVNTATIDVGVGRYRVEMTDITNCSVSKDSVTVTGYSIPTQANAGPDQLICNENGAPMVQLAGTVQSATGGIWSGGGGAFSNTTDLNATYTPTSQEVSNGSVTLRLTTTNTQNTTCPSHSDEVIIRFAPRPVLTAGPDKTVCSNNAAVSLEGAVTSNPYWSGTVLWSGGSGTFFPSNTSPRATYTPSAAELEAARLSNTTIRLTLTSTGMAPCQPVSDEVVITITPAPLVNAGPDQMVCSNNNNGRVTLSGAVSVGGVAGTGTWVGAGTFSDVNSLTPTYTPTASEISAGVATLTLRSTSNGLCNPVEDQVVIRIIPAPVLTIDPAQSICANNARVQLNATLVNPQGITLAWSSSAGGTFSNTTILNPVFTPSTTEINAGRATLTLRATGNGCTEVVRTVDVTITPAPVVTASDQTVCANNARVTLNGSVTIGGVASTGEWIGGSGTFSNRTALNATYTPSSTEISAGVALIKLRSTNNGNCTPVERDVRITITPAPIVTASNQTVCANNALVTLNGSVTIGGLASTGEWIGGSGIFSNRTALNATYTPSSTDISAGFAEFKLRSTANGNCIPVETTVRITITPAPIVNAGPDQNVCTNNINVKLDGSLQHASIGTWRGGAGEFSSRTDLKATYTPTAQEISNGSVTLTLEATAPGCNPVSDAVVINFTPAPTANAGPPRLICASNPSVTITGRVTGATGGTWTGGNGTFLPNPNSLEITYIPTQKEINDRSVILRLTTTGIGNCLPVSSSVMVVITPAPVVNAGDDIEACFNNPEVKLNGSVENANDFRWQGGLGSFIPGPTSLDARYIPTQDEVAAGSVRLTLVGKNNECAAVTDDVVIRFAPSPVANAGPDRTICANNARVELTGTVTRATGGTWSGGGGSFTPNTNALNAVYTPTAAEIQAGTVRLTLTTTGNGLCNAVTDEMVVTITPAPIANAGPDQTVCANNSNVRLAGSVTRASGGVWSGGNGTFTPNAATLNATYLPTEAERAAGSVKLTLTTTGVGNCTVVTDEMVITITPAPVVDAGADLIICADNPKATLAGKVTVATGGVWSGGLGTYSPNANTLNAIYTPSAAEIQAGEVTLTLASVGPENCMVVTDRVKITIAPAPVVSAGPSQTVCGTNSNVRLNGTVTNAQGGLWTTAGSGSFSPNASALNATYIPSAADISNKSVQLTLTTTGNGVCRPVSSSMNISFTDAPTINAGPDQTVCTNNLPIQLAGRGSSAIWSGGAGTFNPNNSTLNATYMPTAQEIAAGRITLRLTTIENGACPSISDEVIITIPPSPIVNAGQDVTVCSDATIINLNGFVSNAGGGTWTSSGRGSFGNANSLATTYALSNAERVAGTTITLTLTSTGNGACPEVKDQLIINVTPAPTANAGGNKTICADADGVQLNGSITVASGGIWSGGAGTFVPNNTTLNAFYIPTPAERDSRDTIRLTLTTTGNGDCKPAQDISRLIITPTPTANAGNDQVICADAGSINLEGSVTLNGQTPAFGGGIWTSNGNGTFSPNHTQLKTSYIPSAEDITRGRVTFTLVTEPNGTCKPVEDQVVVYITPVPTVNAGPAQTVCGDTDGVQLAGSFTAPATGAVWSTNGSGTFSNATALNAVYVPSEADTRAGTVTLTLTTTSTTPEGATCKPVRSQTTITFIPPVILNAGEDVTVCSDIHRVELKATINVPTGFVWAVEPEMGSVVREGEKYYYMPSASARSTGMVRLTVTSNVYEDCKQVQDELIIRLTPTPVVSAGTYEPVCADAESIQLNGTATIGGSVIAALWKSSGTGTFSPNATALNAIYIPSDRDKTTGSVTLTLVSTGNGTCTPVESKTVLIITPTPIVNAGADKTICADASGVQLNGSVLVAGGGRWTTSGKGTFADATALNTVYTPHADDIIAGQVVLTLTSTDNGTCKPVADNMVVTITPAPTVTAVAALSVCADAPSVTLTGSVTIAKGGVWTTDGTGTFTPGATNLNPTYVFSPEDLANIPAGGKQLRFTLTTTENGDCRARSAETIVTITPTPTINAGPDQTLCADVQSVQLAGSVSIATGVRWTTNGSGTFTPGVTVTNAQYIPSLTDKNRGKVELTLTSTGNGTCNPVLDKVELTFVPVPTADAGPDQTVCADTDGVYLTGIISGATGAEWSTLSGEGRFEPGKDAMKVVFIPSARQIQEGIARVILTTTGVVNENGDVICSPATARVTITITPRPIVNAGQAQTICADAAGVQLNGIITNAPGGRWSTSGTGTFNNATALNAFYTPSADDRLAGKVTLTLTATGNELCKTYFRSVELFITPAPTLTLSEVACMDEQGARLGAAITVASGVSWTGGAGTFSSRTNLTPTYRPSTEEIAAGTVTLTATTTGNGSCNPVSRQIVINIKRAPVINPGPSQVVCANIGEVQLNGDVKVFNGTTWVTSTGVWSSNGGGTFEPSANALNARYVPTAADIQAGRAVLTLTSTNTTELCRPYSATVIIEITSPIPSANAGTDLSMCADGDFVTLRGSVGVADGGKWYRFDGSTTGIANPNSLNTHFTPTAGDRSAGQVKLVLETTGNGICNSAFDTMTVFITPRPVLTIPANDVVCSSSEFYYVSASYTVATGVKWSITTGTGSFENTSNPSIAKYIFSEADKAGTVVLKATTEGMEPCKPVSKSFTIQFTPAPEVNAGGSAICADEDEVPLLGWKNAHTGQIRWKTTGDGEFTDATTLQTKYIRGEEDKKPGAVVKLYIVNIPEPGAVCDEVADTITLDLKPTPIAKADADQSICSDQESVQVSGKLTNANSGKWTSSGGTGTFTNLVVTDAALPNEKTITATYTPSQEDREAGSILLILETISDCTPGNDTLVLTITPKATVDIQPETMCIEGEYVVLNGVVTNGNGQLQWSSTGTGTFSAETESTTRYTPSEADRANYDPANPLQITLVTQGLASCGPVSKTINLHMTPPPTAQIDPKGAVCASDETIALAAGSNGGDVFNWYQVVNSQLTPIPNGNGLTVNYQIADSDRLRGQVTIRFVAKNQVSGCEGMDEITIPLTPGPVVTVDMSTICTTANVITLKGNVANSSGFIWTVASPSGQPGSFADASKLETTYTLSPDEESNKYTLVFTLTASGNGSCSEVSKTVTLNQRPAPEVNAGPDVVICASTPGVVAQLRGAVGQSVVWSGGEGTFENGTDLNAIYTPSSNEIEKGKLGDYAVTLYLTSTDGECSAVTDSMQVIIQKEPVAIADAGDDVDMCATTQSIQLAGIVQRAKGGFWTTRGDGSFDDPARLDAVYTPGTQDRINNSVELVLETVSGDANTIYGCDEATDVLTLRIRPVPVIEVPGAAICSDESAVQLSSIVKHAEGVTWSTSGTGFFTNRNSLTPRYVPSEEDKAAQTIYLYVDSRGNGVCNPVRETITLNIAPPPVIYAGEDLEVCAEQNEIIVSGSVTRGSITNSQWVIADGAGLLTNNGLQATYIPSDIERMGSKIKLVLTATGSCTPENDTLDITILPPVLVSIANVATVCVEDTEIQLKGSIENAEGVVWSGGTGTFSPNAFDLNARYNITQQDREAGSITLTLTTTGTGDCDAQTAQVIIDFTPIITLSLADITAVCADQQVVPLNASISPNGRQIEWKTSGTGTFIDPTDVNTSYRPSPEDRKDEFIILSVRTTDTGDCREEYAQTKLILEPVPAVDAGLADAVCAEGAVIKLNGSVERATSVQWSALTVNGTTGTDFTNASALQTDYIPTEAEKEAGLATLILTATREGCNAVTDTVKVIITQPIRMEIDNPQITVCDDVPFVQLDARLANASEGIWTHNGEGYFTPSANALDAKYYFRGNDKQNGSVIFTLTATSTGACYDETQNVNVTIVPAPTVIAGNDATLCEDVEQIRLEGVLLNNEHGASATWRTTGQGTIVQESGFIATYTPTEADKIAGRVTFILESSGPITCEPVTESVVYYFEKAPAAHAGPDQTVCADAGSVQLQGRVSMVSGGKWTTSGNGHFLPGPDALNATYVFDETEKANPGTAILLTLTTDKGNNCEAAIDQVVINITPRPTVKINAPDVVCADVEFIDISAIFNAEVSAGVLWQSSGRGDFTPSISAAHTRYKITAEDRRIGRVAFTVTTEGSGTCNEVSDSKIIRIAPTPIVLIDPVQPVCADVESIILSASRSAAHQQAYPDLSSVWSSPSSDDPDGGYFYREPYSLNVRYYPSAAERASGSVTITLTTANTGACKPSSNQTTIYFTPAPIANAGPDQAICADADGFTVTGKVQIATQGRWTTTGTGSFDNENELQTTYRPSVNDIAAGSVKLILNTVESPGDVCSSVADTMTLTINPAPYIVAGPATVCGDSRGVKLYGEIIHATGGRWTTAGSGKFSPNEYDLNATYLPSEADIAAGSVLATLTSEGNGLCKPVSIQVTIFISPLPVADAGPDQIICRNASTTLLAKPLPGVTYEWRDGSGRIIGTEAMVLVTARENSRFILKVMDEKTCGTEDTVWVNVIDPPVLNLPAQYCFEAGMKIDASPGRMPAVSGSFQWYRNDTLMVQEKASSLIVHQPGRYVVQYSYGGCTVYDTTLVNTPPVLAGPDRQVCTGTTLTIHTTKVTGALYRWTHNGNPVGTNADSLTVTVNANERYVVAVTNRAGCTSFDTIQVTVVPPPVFTLSNVPSCVGETVVISGKPANINDKNATYTWFKGDIKLPDTTASISVRASGEYTVQYKLGECITTASSVVTFHDLPVTNMADVVTFCQETDGHVTLDAGPGHTYLWLASGNTTRTLDVSEPGMYYVKVFNENNCATLDSIYVRNACRPRVFVPTAISPTKPGPDSKLQVFGANYQNFKLTIFNRWGEIIFFTEDPNQAWDGTYRGELMPVGVYAWTVYYEGTAEEFVGPYSMQGSVTVIR